MPPLSNVSTHSTQHSHLCKLSFPNKKNLNSYCNGLDKWIKLKNNYLILLFYNLFVIMMIIIKTLKGWVGMKESLLLEDKILPFKSIHSRTVRKSMVSTEVRSFRFPSSSLFASLPFSPNHWYQAYSKKFLLSLSVEFYGPCISLTIELSILFQALFLILIFLHELVKLSFQFYFVTVLCFLLKLLLMVSWVSC